MEDTRLVKTSYLVQRKEHLEEADQTDNGWTTSRGGPRETFILSAGRLRIVKSGDRQSTMQYEHQRARAHGMMDGWM